ncbi:MAG: hypothetical protein IJX35_01845, partial [Candidatus Methanomethylophilaceae archaeon]|nr:hypothetical protein [Candidatus Methanomethylophilaceae archaeon]
VILGVVNDTDTGGRTPLGKAIFSGTVASKADGADVSMKFDRASGFTLVSMAEDEVDGKVDYLYLYMDDFSGKATAVSGKVTTADIDVGATDGDVITIASGAMLTVPEGSDLIVGENGLIVDGTLDVKGDVYVVGKAVVNGAMNVEGDGVVVSGELIILGILLMKEEASGVIEGELIIDDGGSLIVGERIGTLGATGTVIGKVTIDGSNGTGYVKAYPGSDITGAKINYVVDASEAKSTSFYINGELYMTVYALSGGVNAISVALASDWVNNTVGLNISGIDTTGAKTPAKWFTDAAYTDPLATDITVGAEESIYFDAPISEATVKISVGTGMSLWIDGVKYTSGSTPDLKVGEHSVQVTINPGYKGTASITFNGTTVSNGKIVINADMVGAVNVLSATGDITIDAGETPAPAEKDDGMGITDYLLIVLVVLAAILVVIVAARMMRS